MSAGRAFGRARAERGLALVELMIAMALGLALMAGVLQIYLGTRQAYRVQEAASRLQENVRYAVEALAFDLRSADFFGCARSARVTNDLDPDGSGYVDYPARGASGTNGAAGNPDAVVITGAFGAPYPVIEHHNTSANIRVAAPNELTVGDIVLVDDCTAGDIFQITSGNPGGTGVLVHNTGAAVEPGNRSPGACGTGGGNAHCLSRTYGPDARVHRVQSVAYSIAAGAGVGRVLFRNGEEIVEGVEDLQILYGEDTDGDRTANRYLPPGSEGSMGDVVSLRLSLLFRSLEDRIAMEPQTYTYDGATVTAGDRRLYRVVTLTLSLRNRLP